MAHSKAEDRLRIGSVPGLEAIGRRRMFQYFGGAALAVAVPAWVARAAPARTVAQDVARWLLALRYEELPAEVVARAKRVLLDTIGCALGAIAAEPVRIAQQVVAQQGGHPQATVLGTGQKVACDQAAFLNGMALRYFDYNDYVGMGRPNHASINVAAALAAAEMQGLSGRDLLLGLVAGYELEVRLRDAIVGKRREGWDDTSIEAQYACAAAAGKLFRLDEAKLANALAIAGSNANTLAEVRRGAELTPAKGSAEPLAARNGVFAALLARAGLAYPLTIFEGENGFARIVAGSFDEAILRQRSGEFGILKSCIKLWPCVGTAQAPIAAAIEVHGRHPDTDDIAGIAVALSDFAYRQQIAYPEEISTREHADHSIPYTVARALVDGDVRVTDFAQPRFKDPRALALKRRLSLRRDASLSDENLGANLDLTLQNGAMLSVSVPIPPGNMLNPASDAELRRKFLTLSEAVLGKERAEKAIEVILAVDMLPDLGNLLSALSPMKQ
jgi:2-methylcitrate dehydratase